MDTFDLIFQLIFLIFILCLTKFLVKLWKTTEVSGVWKFFSYVVWYIYIGHIRKQKGRLNECVPWGTTAETFGFLPNRSENEHEHPRKLGNNPESVDGITFTGTDSKGTVLIITFNRRPKNKSEIWLYLRLPDGRQFTLPQHPDTVFHTNESEYFTGSGILIECLEPMTRWRIVYNGLLRQVENKTDNYEEAVTFHVRFNLTWKALSVGLDYMKDIHHHNMASAIANDDVKLRFCTVTEKLVCSQMNKYDQYGIAEGKLIVDNTEMALQIRGLRTRHIDFSDWSLLNACIQFSGHTHSTGDSFLIGISSHVCGFSRIKFGYVFKAKGQIYLMERTNLTLNEGLEARKSGKIAFSFTANDVLYSIQIDVEKDKLLINTGEKWEAKFNTHPIKCILNGEAGTGIAKFGIRNKNKIPVHREVKFHALPEICKEQNVQNLPYLLDFNDERCRISTLVGGKGASLASLASICQHEFSVSLGVCVTIEAYSRYLHENNHVREALRTLDSVACKRKTSILQDQIERTKSLFETIPISSEITKAIGKHLKNLFGQDFTEKLFAVRSSAVGEDSSDLSAAGQNETFLGVKSLPEIELAIRKCWASQFSFQAIEYRRQHGQAILCPMAVVVQEMVPSEVAGVMFTRDPASGNPGIMTITANYGLGESVVSASAEPDTIHVTRTWDDRLFLGDKQIGGKETKIQMREDGGTEEIAISFKLTRRFSVSDNFAIRLARIGLLVEHAFSDSRDIEFAIADNEIYLLQARPITFLFKETDEEISEEFSTGLVTDFEYTSNANLAEVFPGAFSPLSLSSSLKQFYLTFQGFLYYKLPRKHFTYQANVLKGFAIRFNTVFFNLGEFLTSLNLSMDEGVNTSFEVSLFGRPLGLGELYQRTAERLGKRSFYTRIAEYYEMFWQYTFHTKVVNDAWEKYWSYVIPVEEVNSAQDCFDIIKSNFPIQLQTAFVHAVSTTTSNHFNGLLCQMLDTCSSSEERFSIVAKLLSSCKDIHSADVPHFLEHLATIISEDKEADDFVKMEQKDALDWLRAHKGEVGKEFGEFLHKHGHRCIKEFDLYSKPWGLNPLPVVENLQIMVKHLPNMHAKPKDETAINEVIKQLPLTWKKRSMLKLFLPYCRRAVGKREQSKSLCIKVVHIFRLAYLRLGELLVNEGRLPDSELVFFFTIWELSELLSKRSPRLVSKGVRRKRLQNHLNTLQYPEFCIGKPEPIDKDSVKLEAKKPSSNTNRVSGTPVSQGIVKGVARVISNVIHANEIQADDILITYATDIAWSPYFPLLSGVVTEMGGLISHGAVVAREYGLPCIVNAKGATYVFRTGDEVLLNATNGFIEKIEGQ